MACGVPHPMGPRQRRRPALGLGARAPRAALAAVLLGLVACWPRWPSASLAGKFESAGSSVDKGLKRAKEGLQGVQRRVAPQNRDTLERQVADLKASGKKLVQDAQTEGEVAVLRAARYLDKAKGRQKKIAEKALDKAKADANLAVEKAKAKAKQRVRETEERLKRLAK